MKGELLLVIPTLKSGLVEEPVFGRYIYCMHNIMSQYVSASNTLWTHLEMGELPVSKAAHFLPFGTCVCLGGCNLTLYVPYPEG